MYYPVHLRLISKKIFMTQLQSAQISGNAQLPAPSSVTDARICSHAVKQSCCWMRQTLGEKDPVNKDNFPCLRAKVTLGLLLKEQCNQQPYLNLISGSHYLEGQTVSSALHVLGDDFVQQHLSGGHEKQSGSVFSTCPFVPNKSGISTRPFGPLTLPLCGNWIILIFNSDIFLIHPEKPPTAFSNFDPNFSWTFMCRYPFEFSRAFTLK